MKEKLDTASDSDAVYDEEEEVDLFNNATWSTREEWGKRFNWMDGWDFGSY